MIDGAELAEFVDLRGERDELALKVDGLQEDLDAAHDEITSLTRDRDEARERIEKLESVLEEIENTARAAQ